VKLNEFVWKERMGRFGSSGRMGILFGNDETTNKEDNGKCRKGKIIEWHWM